MLEVTLWALSTLYNEPKIFYKDFLVGVSNNLIDVVFHDNNIEDIKADYIECKANIHFFIDLKQSPPEMRSTKHRNKWMYINKVHEYLASVGFVPNIFIATFTNDVSDYQQKLLNCNLGLVTILNEEDLFNMIS